MKEFWNERYSAESYAYGTEPNEFFKDSLEKYKISGKILLPAEGEGRNGVYAAQKGLQVYAFDTSEEGRKKALKLAAEKGVEIDYEAGDFFELNLVREKFDAVGLIYSHFPPIIRNLYFRKMTELLNPGGYIIMEVFSVNNLAMREKYPGIGGPASPELLYTTDDIKKYFSGYEIIKLEEEEVELKEGLYHNGKGKVVRFIGQKKAL